MTDDELYESICTLGEKDLASDEHFAKILSHIFQDPKKRVSFAVAWADHYAFKNGLIKPQTDNADTLF